MRITCALGIAAALFVRCSPLHAECITPPPPCEALKEASVVALVEAIEGHRMEDVPNRPGVVRVRTDVRLRILELLKGVLPDQREVAVIMPFRAETAWLSTGKTYLAYAYAGVN